MYSIEGDKNSLWKKINTQNGVEKSERNVSGKNYEGDEHCKGIPRTPET